MTTREYDKYKDLIDIFNNRQDWYKARTKFFVLFICSLFKVQTVSFIRLAQGFDSNVMIGSNLRRIQWFFANFDLDKYVIAKLVFVMLPETPPYRLCLDRTNWKFGVVDIIILMLSVAYKGVAIPLLWNMLPKKGTSNTEEREILLNKYIELFGIDSIECLMADREFIGSDWFDQLIFKKIPFYIRIRGNMWINVPGKGMKKAFWLFNDLKLSQARYYEKIVKIDNNLV